MKRGAGFALIAVLVFVVSFAALFVGRSFSWSGDTLPSELLPLAILKNGGPDFTGLVPADPAVAYGFRSRNGRVVSVYPLMAGLLHVPAVLTVRAAGIDAEARRIGLARLSAAWIAAAATAFFFLALDALVRRSTALLFTAIFLFGTEVFSVAGRGLWQHGSALLFINASLALLASGSSRAKWAGLTLALAVASRPATLLLALPLTLWVARRHRESLPAFLALTAIPAAVLAAYSAVWLGSPFAMGQLQGVESFQSLRPGAIAGVLLSPSRGLFVFSPVLLLAAYGLRSRPADAGARSLVAHAALFAPALVLLCGFWPNWWGGHSFGYRIITEIVPVLLIPVAIAWDAGGFAFRTLALVLAAASVSVHMLGAYVPGDFNMAPDNIDSHPERLWIVDDSDLLRRIRAVTRRGF